MEPNNNGVVLIVDDTRNLADLYTAWLSDTYTVKTAYGGEDALEQLDNTVDIVLLDRRMPDLAGEEVLATIRERDFDCQVALVTSIEPDTDIVTLGFDDYIQKPVTKPALHTLVESLSIRMDYSEKLQEYFALVSKRVTLQTAMDTDEFAVHPEICKLDNQIRDLQEDIDGLLSDFSNDDFRGAFQALSRDEDIGTAFHGIS